MQARQRQLEAAREEKARGRGEERAGLGQEKNVRKSSVTTEKIPNDPKEPYHELFSVHHLKISWTSCVVPCCKRWP